MSWLGNVDDYALLADREHGLRGSGYSISRDKTWIFLPPDSLLIARELCLELSSWMSVYKRFAVTT